MSPSLCLSQLRDQRPPFLCLCRCVSLSCEANAFFPMSPSLCLSQLRDQRPSFLCLCRCASLSCETNAFFPMPPSLCLSQLRDQRFFFLCLRLICNAPAKELLHSTLFEQFWCACSAALHHYMYSNCCCLHWLLLCTTCLHWLLLCIITVTAAAFTGCCSAAFIYFLHMLTCLLVRFCQIMCQISWVDKPRTSTLPQLYLTKISGFVIFSSFVKSHINDVTFAKLRLESSNFL
jgi:hypothetical protein